jgi:hypothetical protein
MNHSEALENSKWIIDDWTPSEKWREYSERKKYLPYFEKEEDYFREITKLLSELEITKCESHQNSHIRCVSSACRKKKVIILKEDTKP